jgi:hypothetical protein
MAGRPSVVSGYISVILRAIDKAQNDPAQLRELIYDAARLSLGKQLLENYQQLGSNGLQRHLRDLEVAINQIEGFKQNRLEDFSKGMADDLFKGSATTDGSARKPPESSSQALTVQDFFGDSIFQDHDAEQEVAAQKTSAIVVPASTELYREVKAEVLEPLRVWEPVFGTGPQRAKPDLWWAVQLACAAFIGIAIYGAMMLRSNFVPPNPSVADQAVVAPAAVASSAPGAVKLAATQSNSAAFAESFGFPVPKSYGVYAVNDGKLYELDALAMKVPDPRVAISALISDPSRVTIPDGKLRFVIFRRDLVSAAPTEVFVRVVARLDQEMKFSGSAPPTVTKIDGQWAIRSKSFEFRVAPLGDNPEMVILNPADQQLSLSPGRYALVLAGRGYDFAVAGKISDTAQCLERSDVLGGAVYSECRKLQ